MLASGRSVEYSCRLVAERGCSDITVICAIAARPGIESLIASGLVSHLVTAAVDDSLNPDGYVVPGMGDAGDRQFDDLFSTTPTIA
jgi:uracil phosphoribosyltransferase